MSIEDRLKRREYAKSNPKGFALNPAKYGGPKRKPAQESCLVCKECQARFSVRLWQSNRKYCSAACSNKNKYHKNSSRVHRTIYKGVQLDSGAELNFVKLLDRHGIHWHKNVTKYYEFVDSTGKNRKYYPDFYLKDYDFWVEIKGKRYVRPDDDLRLKAVGPNIQLMFSNNIRLPDCVMATYEGSAPSSPTGQAGILASELIGHSITQIL